MDRSRTTPLHIAYVDSRRILIHHSFLSLEFDHWNYPLLVYWYPMVPIKISRIIVAKLRLVLLNIFNPIKNNRLWMFLFVSRLSIDWFRKVDIRQLNLSLSFLLLATDTNDVRKRGMSHANSTTDTISTIHGGVNDMVWSSAPCDDDLVFFSLSHWLFTSHHLFFFFVIMMILTSDRLLHFSLIHPLNWSVFDLDTPRMGPSDFRAYTTTGTTQGREERWMIRFFTLRVFWKI